MKRAEIIFREILFQAIEKKNRTLTQAELSRNLSISLSVINGAVKDLEKLGAIEIKPRVFHVLDVKKILFYWASVRDIQKDIIYSTRIEKPVKEIEKLMPDNIVFGAYTAFKFLFKDVPADYSEVYVYGDKSLSERFPESNKIHNFFVLAKDSRIDFYGKTTTTANTFVDLWNLREWYAKEFVKTLEAKLHGVLE